ncbi:MAG: hypothetical protein LUE64_06745 [Candidatus Gastranaerophilales bacterium]|nr:hypothetical protein [Candidatus Gastranaerophilales bacterium]
MLTNGKKSLIHTALTVILAISVAQCAWAGLDKNSNLLALDANGISVYDNSSSHYNNSTDDTYIIDASSPEAASVPSTTKLTGNVQVADDSVKISISLRDADVKQVLRMFADKANMNIIFHNSAQGEITLDLKDVSINTALEFVLDACELTYVRQDNNMIIASKSAAKDLSFARQNFTTVPVHYVNAQLVADFLNKSMFNGKYQGVSSVPIVAVNATKNELMIFGTEEDEKLVYRLLDKLDTKPMMNVFPVNHITPAEMAGTICDLLLSDRSEGSSNTTTIEAESRSSGGEDDEIELGGGYIACVAGESGGSIDNDSDSEDLTNYVSNPLTIAFFPQLGTVAAYGGSREQVKMVEGFIKLHDKKQPMAYIEIAMIQLTESGSKQFNTEWKAWTPFGTFIFDSNGLYTDTWGPSFLKGNSYDVLDDEGEIEYTINKNHGWGPLVMSLNYLISNGKGRVLASPKVMVTNGKTSTIDLTSDYVKTVKQEYDTNSTTAVAQTTYEIGSDQGIKVEITPFISPEGYVIMNLKPDYSIIAEQRDEYTLLSRRNLELENVRVKDGETLVLAGLIHEDEAQTTVKMPILGDLPLVGAFFRRSQNSLSKEELVILITPHIVYSKEQIENLKATQNL